MSRSRHADELAWEQSVNERYLRRADAAAEDAGRGLNAVTAPASTGWTGSGPKKPRRKVQARPLVGRVALTLDDEDLGPSFYVAGEGGGFTRLDDGISVVSWAAPVARLFYEGRGAPAHSPEGIDPRTLAARRTFNSQGRHLVDFEDEREPGTDPETAFTRRAGLSIPAPPEGSERGPIPPPPERSERGPIPPPKRADGERARFAQGRTTDRGRPPGATSEPAAGRRAGGAACAQPPDMSAHGTGGAAVTEDGAPDAASPEDGSAPATAPERGPRPREPGRRDSSPPAGRATGRPRAERLLMKALDAPKTGPLAPVLSTLQPEQYRLVTWPSEQNLVVQGHPGTGKTIVAAHRAAYLVLPKDQEGEGPRLDKVALVGPTERWKAHIEPAVARLVDGGVEVLSLESLIREWSHDLRHPLHRPDEREFESLWAIGRILDAAAQDQRGWLLQIRRGGRVRELVNSLVQDTGVHRRLVPREDADLSKWLLAAGDYRNARRDPSYLLFMAAAGIVTGQLQPAHSNVQHIVVDEAQDLRPVEWWMLSKLFRAGAGERWSVFGDMNQRRSDFTWESWERFADLLQLSAEDAAQLPRPEELDCGYRSTREILGYAGALLPRGGRAQHALRGGPEPSVRQVGRKQVVEAATEEAERLASRYHQGSVAVIAYLQETVDEIERPLTTRRWRRDRDGGDSLRRDHRGCRLNVIRPVEARGLEFDAVVVVEPADFKPSLGRHGELYTSLTRANQELVVVHSKAMPKELRGRGNRTKE